ncbi:7159_t:CDS:1, partial [Gigaspora rosea]
LQVQEILRIEKQAALTLDPDVISKENKLEKIVGSVISKLEISTIYPCFSKNNKKGKEV